MNIAIIGANGQLGTDLMKVISKSKVTPLTHDDIEITNRESVFSVLQKIKPHTVINAAAYNDVDGSEDNPVKAISVNALGVNIIADACRALDAIMVHFSTDYVFGADTERKHPYTENDREGPLNMYGISKLCGEKMVMAKIKKYFLIRTAVLYGAAGLLGKGDNFVETIIRKGREQGTVNIVNDQYISPTYSRNLAECVYEIIQTENYGLYHMVSGGACTRYEFAKKIFELMALPVTCVGVSSDAFITRAKRPNYSVLDNTKYNHMGLGTMCSWEENIKEYLREKKYIR